MSCILRVWGADLAVDALAIATPLTPYRLSRKGEHRHNSARQFDRSSAHFSVSDLDLDEFEGQVGETIRFLEQHSAELKRILAFPGVEGAVLDFGLAWRDVAAQVDRLPAALITLAGNLGIGIELSHYSVSEPDSAEAAGA